MSDRGDRSRRARAATDRATSRSRGTCARRRRARVARWGGARRIDCRPPRPRAVRRTAGGHRCRGYGARALPGRVGRGESIAAPRAPRAVRRTAVRPQGPRLRIASGPARLDRSTSRSRGTCARRRRARVARWGGARRIDCRPPRPRAVRRTAGGHRCRGYGARALPGRVGRGEPIAAPRAPPGRCGAPPCGHKGRGYGSRRGPRGWIVRRAVAAGPVPAGDARASPGGVGRGESIAVPRAPGRCGAPPAATGAAATGRERCRDGWGVANRLPPPAPPGGAAHRRAATRAAGTDRVGARAAGSFDEP